jgi:hypothetical protein
MSRGRLEMPGKVYDARLMLESPFERTIPAFGPNPQESYEC